MSKSETGLKYKFNFCSLGAPTAPNPNFQIGFCFGAFVQNQNNKSTNKPTNGGADSCSVDSKIVLVCTLWENI